VHRDLTPQNVFLCDDGQVKVLDLGMAHVFGRRKLDGGTPAYMAPEQWSGAPEDERTDVYALGAVCYRLLQDGDPLQRPKNKPTGWTPPPALEIPGHPGLGDFVLRMLDQEPVRRPRDAGVVLEALRSFEEELQRSGRAGPAVRTSPRTRWSRRLAIVAAVVGACALVAWLIHRESRIRWAVAVALPQVVRLAEQGRYSAAFALAKRVENVAPKESRLLELWPEVSRLVTIETTPEGADVYAKEYSAPETEWQQLGRTPIVAARLPLARHHIRIEKQGFMRVDAVPTQLFPGPPRSAHATDQIATIRVTLDAVGTIPPEMVRVPGGSSVTLELCGLYSVPAVQLGDYLIDRTEVTNRAFKKFIDAGGYRRREFWRHDFVQGGRVLPWDVAMALFRDRTGRPGPATWEAGDYPEGQGDLPVTGVSWYEAAAYAIFVGKSLPSVYQWSRAAGESASAQLIPASNFAGKALAPVRSHPGLGPFGTYDMAGNAKEWCWNSAEDRRYILGGAWNEPTSAFNFPDAQSPFSRATNYGFRLVKALDDTTARASWEPIPWNRRDYAIEKPVKAELFDVFKRLYAYDRSPLDVRVEANDDSSDRWRKAKVSFTAAYGDERLMAYVFTPRHFAPPFQTVLFFPDGSAMISRSSDQLTLMNIIGPLVRSGRAVLYPVYKSTYERGDTTRSIATAPTASFRDHVIMWSKDVSRAIDYIETRNDLDARRIALYGVTWGAKLVPLIAAVEDRVRVGVIVAGGFAPQASMPEVDPFNFAPYLHQPMLMLNGRHDFFYPLDTNQRPLFDLLGSPPRAKRHVVFESERVPPNEVLTKEVLDWLDLHLGPPVAVQAG
jgi:formylglycine-generating enzyme required for sulfatase activity